MTRRNDRRARALLLAGAFVLSGCGVSSSAAEPRTRTAVPPAATIERDVVERVKAVVGL